MKLVVITGFLGSGKTTHLLRLLGGRRDDTAVIVNEFAETGIDQEVIAPHCAKTVAITGGCACCDQLGAVLDALRSLLDDQERGRLKVSTVFVETSGLADPLPIVRAVASDPVLHHHYELDRVVAVVDGVEGTEHIERHPEVRRQVLAADEVFVSKADIAGTPRLEAVRARLAAIGSEPSAHTHTEGVESVCLEFPRPLDWVAFGVWLSLLVHAHGPRLLRIKGVVPADGVGAVAVNAVHDTLFPPQHVPSAPAGARLVVIAQGLDTTAVERSLLAFQGAA